MNHIKYHKIQVNLAFIPLQYNKNVNDIIN